VVANGVVAFWARDFSYWNERCCTGVRGWFWAKGFSRFTHRLTKTSLAQMTEAGNYPRIALGIATMSVLVVAMNRLVWRPLYAFAERRTRLD
jgi:ABC-type anion transport system duplicated permease subunit